VPTPSARALDTTRLFAVRRAIRRWYLTNARDLPWRRTSDPYCILVSEIMLQQTQVDRVVPKYRAFLARFPTLRSLAKAPLADVLRMWSGLGYNSRAKRLWESAKVIVAGHEARVPSDIEALRGLPGIGRYTASAVASFAFGAREAVVDVNVRRVLARALLGRESAGDAEAWTLAKAALPRAGAGVWSQALMDVGARFCRPVPDCAACPARRACAFGARENASNIERIPKRIPKRGETFVGSRRYYRGRVVRALAGAHSLRLLALGKQVKDGFATSDLPWLRALLDDLQREGLIALSPRHDRAALP
jgi:A/G-specific adenine glycosylase